MKKEFVVINSMIYDTAMMIYFQSEENEKWK